MKVRLVPGLFFLVTACGAPNTRLPLQPELPAQASQAPPKVEPKRKHSRRFPDPPPPQAIAAVSRMPARYLRSLEYAPGGYSAEPPPGGEAFAGADNDLLLGDLLFHSPHTLGARARSLGISCQSCHPNGAAHTELFIEPVSDRPGNIDLSSGFFRAAADDGLRNPLNVPSLRGCRYTAPYGHDGRIASLSEFIQGVVSVEFGGQPLSQRQLAALTRYVADLDFLPNANLDAKNRLTPRASRAARRGAVLFQRKLSGFGGVSCASCHPPSSFFRDGQVHRLGTGLAPSPHSVDGGYETPSLLGLSETAPYFHDGRFASLRQVVDWFNESFELHLSEQARSDLTAYVAAVGAVDRPRDDRPLARELDQVFAYTTLLTAQAEPALWVFVIDAVMLELNGEPAAVRSRVRELREHLTQWRKNIQDGAPLEPMARKVRALRTALARLAADWAGAAHDIDAGVEPP